MDAELEKRLRKTLAELPRRLEIERAEMQMFREEGDDEGLKTSAGICKDLLTEQRLIEEALLGDIAAVSQLRKRHMLP
jgi:hypothetical protein